MSVSKKVRPDKIKEAILLIVDNLKHKDMINDKYNPEVIETMIIDVQQHSDLNNIEVDHIRSVLKVTPLEANEIAEEFDKQIEDVNNNIN